MAFLASYEALQLLNDDRDAVEFRWEPERAFRPEGTLCDCK